MVGMVWRREVGIMPVQGKKEVKEGKRELLYLSFRTSP